MLYCVFLDPNDKDDEGATPLHFAARYKRMRLVQPESTPTDMSPSVSILQIILVLHMTFAYKYDMRLILLVISQRTPKIYKGPFWDMEKSQMYFCFIFN